jgi:two-component system sensor histidine kinase KdpD
MSRIESGFLKLNLQFCDISDLIGISVNELKNNLTDRQVKIEIEEKLPLIHADINLLKQALINVLHNAMVYTPSSSPILISSFIYQPGKIAIRIRDFGPGVSPGFLPRIFDKFYRIPGTKSGGTGLGLTITKAIAEAHHGKVKAENAVEGGLQITLILNLDVQNGKDKE